jgi:hypothetical protein
MRDLWVADSLNVPRTCRLVYTSSPLLFSYIKSSFGWDPSSKLEELFAPVSRFILVHAEGKLVGFVMFRFEYEYRENILYW